MISRKEVHKKSKGRKGNPFCAFAPYVLPCVKKKPNETIIKHP